MALTGVPWPDDESESEEESSEELGDDVSGSAETNHSHGEEISPVNNNADEVSGIESDQDGESSRESIPHTNTFEVGHHIFKWCNLGPIPKAYVRHGIVVRVEDNQDFGNNKTLTILDFWCDLEGARRNCTIRKQKESSLGWQRVLYSDAPSIEGIDTTADEDREVAVEARIDFVERRAKFHPVGDSILVSRAHVPFPKEDQFFHSNCECFAVWIVTGSWTSLQGLNSALRTGGVAGTLVATGASLAALQGIVVSAGGLWGFLGFTVPLGFACPWLIPVAATDSALAGYGAAKKTEKELQKYWSSITLALKKSMAD